MKTEPVWKRGSCAYVATTMHIRWNDEDRRNTMSRSKNLLKRTQDNEVKTEVKKDKRMPRSGLYRASFPIYYFGKLCGLVPVRFVAHTIGRCQARLSIIDLVYSFCVLILLLGSEIWGLWRDLKDGWEYSTRLKSRTAIIATCSDVLGVMSLTVVCIVGSPFRWKYLQVVINKLIEVDEKLGVSPAKKSRRFTICLTVCNIAYLWLNSGLDFYAWDRKTKDSRTMGKGPINYAPLYLMYTVIISTEIQYTVSTYNVGQRFVNLNNSLESLFDSGSTADHFGKFVVGIENEPYVKGISELITIHSSLCDVVSLINSTFGIVILAVTVTSLLHLIITPYFLILQANEKNEWIYLIVQCMWCIFHVSRMLIIVQPSYSAIAEGKRTAVLVSQLLSSSFKADDRQQLEIFSLQLLHRPLEFSACGLFSLDRTLITSIAGVVTTYLVILIQFQNADDTKGEVDIIKNATQILKTASSSLQNFTGLKTGF